MSTSTAPVSDGTPAAAPVLAIASNADLPKCRLCDHEAHWLGDHLVEQHDTDIDSYLRTFPGATTVSQEALDLFESERRNNVRRLHPVQDSALHVQIGEFPVSVNADVPASACLMMPDCYRLPKTGDLAIDVTEAIISYLMGRHVYIHGLPGAGKDALFHFLSAVLRRPTLMRQVLPGTDVEGWIWTREIVDSGTIYQTHELFHALTEGYETTTGRRIPYTVLITDFDRATKAQAEYLRMILDSIGGRVPGPAGKLYDVFPGTQIIVTANTAGGGDTRGRCISANVIDASMLDRFQRKYEFHWMDWIDEEPICKAKFPLLAQRCPSIFAQIGKATNSLRDAIYKSQLYAEFSHRAVCSWLGHAEDIIRITGDVPKDLAARSARAYLDGLPDAETRLAADRLISPHIQGGVIGVGTSDASSDPLGGFS